MDHRIHQVPSQYALNIPKTVKQTQTYTTNFKDFFNKELKISKHASERMNERNIKINEKLWTTINEKIV